MSEAEWQRGQPLEKLQALAAVFKAAHKPLCFGAFGLTKERDIAAALSAGECSWTGQPPRAVALHSVLKHAGHHSDFSGRPLKLPPGCIYVHAFAAAEPASGGRVLKRFAEAEYPTAVEIFEEDTVARACVQRAGFRYAFSKVTAGAEIKGMYFLRMDPPPPLPAEEERTLLQITRTYAGPNEHADILAELARHEERFPWAQHYSSYNKRKSWTAFALRGFDRLDPSFIIKPAEMAKGWQEAHPERMDATPDWTLAAQHFPAACSLVEALPGLKERVRFMRLRHGDGELSRHADITDREAGVRSGCVARLHIPIRTSPAVRFQAWDSRGALHEHHFPERSLFYLDQRKPHRVLNTDPALDRIHLVVDCYVTSILRDMLRRGSYGPAKVA